MLKSFGKQQPARPRGQTLAGETIVGPDKSIAIEDEVHAPGDPKSNILSQMLGEMSTSELKVENISTTCLLDTGSVISTVSENFMVTYLPDVEVKPIEELLVGMKFESASGDDVLFLGYVEVSIDIPDVGQIMSILLVVKDTALSKEIPLLIGTNIMRRLPHHKVTEKIWKRSIKQCYRLYNRFGLVYCDGWNIPANSEVVLEGRAKIPVAEFERTVMCVPVEQHNQKLKIEPVLSIVPSGMGMARIPVKIKNYTDVDIVLNDRLPVYRITTTDAIAVDKQMTPREDALIAQFDETVLNNETLKNLVLEYADIFALDDTELGCCTIGEHEIVVDEELPFKERYRRIPPSMYDDVKQQLETMLQCGVIRESNSPYSSPVTVVAKKDGRARICCDFRTLNRRTKKDAKSLPRIEETIDMMKDAKVFSNLDLMSGY